LTSKVARGGCSMLAGAGLQGRKRIWDVRLWTVSKLHLIRFDIFESSEEAPCYLTRT
jgi:hypothetical protein